MTLFEVLETGPLLNADEEFGFAVTMSMNHRCYNLWKIRYSGNFEHIEKRLFNPNDYQLAKNYLKEIINDYRKS